MQESSNIRAGRRLPAAVDHTSRGELLMRRHQALRERAWEAKAMLKVAVSFLVPIPPILVLLALAG